MTDSPVGELRLALTVEDFDKAVAFYRDTLGLPVEATWDNHGKGIVLSAGRATIELLSTEHAAYLDQIEVGRPAPSPVRLALQVSDSDSTAARLTTAGGTQLADPVATPWGDRNVRLTDPNGIQLTLFS